MATAIALDLAAGLDCPVVPRIHPRWAEMREYTASWAKRFSMHPDPRCAELTSTVCADCVCLLVPFARPEALRALCATFAFCFFVDDAVLDGQAGFQLAESSPVITHLLRVLEEPRSASYPHPFVAAAADIALQFRDCVSDTQRRRVQQSFCEWWAGATWKAGLHAAGEPMGLDDYFFVRRGESGSAVFAVAVEVALSREVPPAELDRPDIRALTNCATTVMFLDNDVISYWKETACGEEASGNIITLLRHAKSGLSTDEARTEAVAIRNRLLTLFLRLREQARDSGSDELRRYVDAMTAAIAGELQFSANSPRFTLRDHGDDPLYPSVYAGPPAEVTPEPLPYPSIASWWQYLR